MRAAAASSSVSSAAFVYQALAPAAADDDDDSDDDMNSDVKTAATTDSADAATTDSADAAPSIESVPLRATATEGGGYRLYRRRWFGLAVLMAQNIVISWGWLTYAPVADLTQQWFGLASASPVNWLSTVIFFSYAVASPAVIYTLSRHGVKPAIMCASLLVLAGNWIRYAGARTQTFGATMLGQILIGFAQPFVLSAPTYYSDLWFTSRGRITATALASLSNPFGAALGELIDPFLCTRADQVPSMTLWVAVITTVACVPWAFVPARPPTPPAASSTIARPSWRESTRLCARSRAFWVVFVLFVVYLGFFNAFSSLLNQIMLPYDYTADEAGITGALLIVVGLIASAIVSPIVDRTKTFLLAIRICVPLIAACYLAFIWAATAAPGNLAAPFVVASLLGASSFALLPLALEYVVEQTWPAAPEVSSSFLWAAGNIVGGVFLIVMDALRKHDGVAKEGSRDGSMKNGLIFEAVVAVAVVPLVLGLKEGGLRRVEVDQSAPVGGREMRLEGIDAGGYREV